MDTSAVTIDWTTIVTTAPLGLLGLLVVGFCGWVAVRANAGLVRVAERLVEAIAAMHGAALPPKAPAPEPSPEESGPQPDPQPDYSAEAEAGFPETEPEGIHQTEEPEAPDEFPPHERLAELLDEFPPPIRAAATRRKTS